MMAGNKGTFARNMEKSNEEDLGSAWTLNEGSLEIKIRDKILGWSNGPVRMSDEAVSLGLSLGEKEEIWNMSFEVAGMGPSSRGKNIHTVSSFARDLTQKSV